MKQEYFPSLRIEIKPSALLLGEVGLFAATDIPKDGLVAEANAFEEHENSWLVYNQLDSALQEKVMSFCVGTKDFFYAPKDFNYLPICWYMNHSCDPNVGFDTSNNFVSMRDIKKGEELCWDYGFGETNPNFSMKCLCGSKECRGVITGDDWKKIAQDKKKRIYMSSDIRI